MRKTAKRKRLTLPDWPRSRAEAAVRRYREFFDLDGGDADMVALAALWSRSLFVTDRDAALYRYALCVPLFVLRKCPPRLQRFPEIEAAERLILIGGDEAHRRQSLLLLDNAELQPGPPKMSVATA